MPSARIESKEDFAKIGCSAVVQIRGALPKPQEGRCIERFMVLGDITIWKQAFWIELGQIAKCRKRVAHNAAALNVRGNASANPFQGGRE